MGDQQLPAYMRYGRATKSGPIVGGYKILTHAPWGSGGTTPSWRLNAGGDSVGRLYIVEWGWHAEGTVTGNPTIEPHIGDSLTMATGTDVLNTAVNLGTDPTGVANLDTSQTYYIDNPTTLAGTDAFLRHIVTLGGGTFADVFLWAVVCDLALYTRQQDLLRTRLRAAL